MREALTLAIDASTYTGTVAVLRGSAVLATRETAMRGEREERLMPAVAGALSDAAVEVAMLERVVCGSGPGSFTSLRIAASLAKGIAMVRAVPLLAVSSLALIVAGHEPALHRGRYLATLDAMRGDVFFALVEITASGEVELHGAPTLVPSSALDDAAARAGATIVGPGRGLPAMPHARGVARLGGSVAPVALADWEPTYGRLAEAQVKWEAAQGRPLPRS